MLRVQMEGLSRGRILLQGILHAAVKQLLAGFLVEREMSIQGVREAEGIREEQTSGEKSVTQPESRQYPHPGQKKQAVRRS
jgi:hypothetical protein